MTRSSILLLPAILALAGCGMTMAGPAVSRAVPVGAFDRIEAAGSHDIRVRTGGAPGVTVSGGADAVDRLDIAVEGGVLKVRDRGSWRRWLGGGERVTVAVSVPMLAGLTVAGAGDASVDRVTGDRFQAKVTGAGDLDLPQVDVGDLDFAVAGAGDVSAAGRARTARVAVSGASDVRLSALRTVDLTVRVAGAGDVDAHASGSAVVEVSGAGDVRIRGGAQCRVTRSGAGDVDCA